MRRDRLLLVMPIVNVTLVVIFAASVALAQPFSPPGALPPPPMPPTPSVLTLVTLVTGHQWLPLALAVLLYVRHMLSDGSKFPVTIPATWLPAVSAALALAYAILVAVSMGASWQQALLGGATLGAAAALVDGLVVGIFGNDPTKVPAWAKAILMLVEPEPKVPVTVDPPAPPK